MILIHICGSGVPTYLPSFLPEMSESNRQAFHITLTNIETCVIYMSLILTPIILHAYKCVLQTNMWGNQDYLLLVLQEQATESCTF